MLYAYCRTKCLLKRGKRKDSALFGVIQWVSTHKKERVVQHFDGFFFLYPLKQFYFSNHCNTHPLSAPAHSQYLQGHWQLPRQPLGLNWQFVWQNAVHRQGQSQALHLHLQKWKTNNNHIVLA